MKRKILVIGGPRCGKTTKALKLCRELHIPIDHFDKYISTYEWSELSEKISDWLDEPGPWIKEGVAGVRGLRKWLRKNKGLPDFEIHILNEPKVNLTPGQARMHKNHSTILQECLDEIEKRKSQGGEKA
jgi:hypothetical protein